MSHSPERISSYRRHFEDGSCSSFQLRVSSPSPTRRHRSASYTRSTTMSNPRSQAGAKRTVSSTRSPRVASISALCLSAGLGAALDLDAATAENREFLSTRTSERKEMVMLNDRLAAYIEKVRTLEQDNKLLETEISALKKHFVKPSGLRGLYEEQLRELHKISEKMQTQRDLALTAKAAMASHLETIKVKFEEAVEARKKAELQIEAFRPDVDSATAARIALEKQMENLEVELDFLKRVHKEELEELMQQIYCSVARVEVSFSLPDLAAALRQIQAQYDDIAAKSLQEMDAWYKAKFEDLTNASNKHVENVWGVRAEMAKVKKDIQGKQRELEALRARQHMLEVQIREAQERHKHEEEQLQDKTETLKLELKGMKEKIALHLREYQDLLNVKMALEIEIVTYRKLIEGEDTRLSGMVSSLSLSSTGHTHTVHSYTREQAVATTERKTLLIRTVRTDEDVMEKDTQEMTIKIYAAASDDDTED